MKSIVVCGLVLVSGCASSTMIRTTSQSPVTAATEERACADVPVDERDRGLLAHRERVAGVEALERHYNPKTNSQPSGAAIVVRAAPGVTEQWLDRVIECHVVHAARAGAERTDPLAVEDTTVAVTPTATGFRIAITADSPVRAREVIARARGLVD